MSRTRARTAGIASGLAVTALGLGVTLGTIEFRALTMTTAAGPAVFPLLVGPALVLVGLLIAIREGCGGTPLGAGALPIRWRRLLAAGAAVGAFALLIRPIGLVIAGAALFACASFAFEGRMLRDTLVGLTVAAVAFALFSAVLGLNVPGLPTFLRP